jgi:DNA (cytosine-5)-methyltransferase 1
MKPKVVSLFAGIGGFDLGLERAGFEVRWQVEIDPFCRKVLDKHWPDVTKYGDIREVNPSELEPVDLICGGFPCQDLSVAGKRAGLAGERSGLFYELLRIADANPSAWVLAENVPGLLSSQQGEDFAIVLGELSGFFPEAPKEGWRNSGVCYGPKGCVAWRVLDAQYFGVAQRRRRVFIVRSPATAGGSAFKVLFESDCLPGNPAPSRGKGQGIAGIFATSPDGSGRETETSPTLDSRAKDGPRRNQGGVIVSVLGHTESNGLGIARQDVANTLESVGSANQPGWSVNSENAADGQLVVAATLRSGGDGEVPSSRGENLIRTVFGFQNQDLAHAIRSNPSKADKPDSSTYVVAPTLRGFGHGWQGQHNDDVARIGMVRRLTPTECERLQGFPDGWTLLPDGNTPDSPRYRALGNAVAVPVAEWIGWRIIEAMKEVAS